MWYVFKSNELRKTNMFESIKIFMKLFKLIYNFKWFLTNDVTEYIYYCQKCLMCLNFYIIQLNIYKLNIFFRKNTTLELRCWILRGKLQEFFFLCHAQRTPKRLPFLSNFNTIQTGLGKQNWMTKVRIVKGHTKEPSQMIFSRVLTSTTYYNEFHVLLF